MTNDDLVQFATAREIDYLNAVKEHGSNKKAAKALGVGRRTVDEAINRVKVRAAKSDPKQHDYANQPVPAGYTIKGVSQYVDKDGKVAGQWVKSSVDAEKQAEMMRAFVTALAEDVKGLAAPVIPPQHTEDQLMVVIPVGDPHFGMYAWSQDAGANFDIDIAERLTKAAIDRLVASSPNAATALLLNLGDMFHADNQNNTSQSGHQLDVDGRWPMIQKVGLMSMIYCIERMLEKYAKVMFRINKGNHDEHSSQGLALMLSCYFHNEPRVFIDLNPSVAWYFQFGKVLLGSTHGDKLKGPDMLPIMAADKPKEWGETVHRHWLVGHVHHHDSKEYRGGIVEYFRTLAARDAWHQGQGYRSGRDMCLIVYHREHGEVERHRCDIGMLA